MVFAIGFVRGQYEEFSVSWYFRGQAVQNNTVLQFNMYDTLNLVCKSVLVIDYEFINSLPIPAYLPWGFFRPWFVITKGASPPSEIGLTENSVDYMSLGVDNPGTLIYSDYNGLQPGFENFVVIVGHQTPYTTQYYRYVNVGVLRPDDSGTYHCSATIYYDYDLTGEEDEDVPELPGSELNYPTSGGLTIMVNTKQGQAHSSRAKSANLLTYSAILLGASKLLF